MQLETEKVHNVINRFEQILDEASIYPPQTMEVYCAHLLYANVICPMDLDAMLTARRADLVHDVAGCAEHFNIPAMRFEDCFLPRFALPEVRS